MLAKVLIIIQNGLRTKDLWDRDSSKEEDLMNHNLRLLLNLKNLNKFQNQRKNHK